MYYKILINVHSTRIFSYSLRLHNFIAHLRIEHEHIFVCFRFKFKYSNRFLIDIFLDRRNS